MSLILNGDTGISAVDGTASAPALVGNDTDTGVYFSAANTLDFATSGTRRASINSTGDLQFNSGYGSVATAYGCRAWVNFNGTTNVGGFCTIRASGGVTSVADNGTGDYTINFSFTMPDTNYSIVGTAKIVGGTGGQNIRIHNDAYATSVTTTAVKVQVTSSGNSALADSEMVNIAIFR